MLAEAPQWYSLPLHACILVIDTRPWSVSKSPRSKSQAGSQVVPPNAGGDIRPTSPRSHVSHAQSNATQHTRVTEKKESTVYPPLPPSQSGPSNIDSSSQMKSYHKSHSRAPSLSPSDSPSQMKSYRNAYGGRSVGKEPPLKPVQSVEDSEAGEGGSRYARSHQNGDSEQLSYAFAVTMLS